MSSFITFYSRDPHRTQAFYELLNLGFIDESHDGGPLHASCRLLPTALEIFAASASSLSEVGTVYGVPVASLEATEHRLRTFGARCIREPAEVGGVRRAVFLDPDGRAVYVFEERPKQSSIKA